MFNSELCQSPEEIQFLESLVITTTCNLWQNSDLYHVIAVPPDHCRFICRW